jgi:2-haloacid dehalogenase
VTRKKPFNVGMGRSEVCHELGIRSVWIDRMREPLNPDWAPHAVLMAFEVAATVTLPKRVSYVS